MSANEKSQIRYAIRVKYPSAVIDTCQFKVTSGDHYWEIAFRVEPSLPLTTLRFPSVAAVLDHFDGLRCETCGVAIKTARHYANGRFYHLKCWQEGRERVKRDTDEHIAAFGKPDQTRADLASVLGVSTDEAQSLMDRTHAQRQADARDTGTAKMVAPADVREKHVAALRSAAIARARHEGVMLASEQQMLVGLTDILLDLLNSDQIAWLVQVLLEHRKNS